MLQLFLQIMLDYAHFGKSIKVSIYEASNIIRGTFEIVSAFWFNSPTWCQEIELLTI